MLFDGDIYAHGMHVYNFKKMYFITAFYTITYVNPIIDLFMQLS
jgi:hypothetical protein